MPLPVRADESLTFRSHARRRGTSSLPARGGLRTEARRESRKNKTSRGGDSAVLNAGGVECGRQSEPAVEKKLARSRISLRRGLIFGALSLGKSVEHLRFSTHPALHLLRPARLFTRSWSRANRRHWKQAADIGPMASRALGWLQVVSQNAWQNGFLCACPALHPR